MVLNFILENIDILNKLYKLYLKSLDSFNFSSKHSNAYKIVQDTIRDSEKFYSNVYKINNSTNITIEQFISNIDNIISFVNLYYDISISYYYLMNFDIKQKNTSSSSNELFLLGIEKQKNSIINNFNSLEINKNDFDEDLFIHIKDNNNKQNELLKKLKDEKKSNIEIKKLYVFLTSKLNLENEQSINIIHNILENETDNKKNIKVENTSNYRIEHIENRCNIIQQLIQRSYLVPYGISMNLDQLITKILNKQFMNNSNNIFDKLELLCKIKSSKTIKIGYIIINKTTENPIETNIWNLIDKKFIIQNELNLSTKAGINEKTIEKYKTIKLIDIENKKENNKKENNKKENNKKENDEKKNIIDKSYYQWTKLHSKNSTNLFYIFETLDGGNNFRIMITEYISSINDEKLPNFYISEHKINYNSNLIPSLIPEYYNDNLDILESFELKRPYKEPEFSNFVIQAEIKTTLVKNLEEVLNNQKINNSSNFYNIIINKESIKLMENAIKKSLISNYPNKNINLLLPLMLKDIQILIKNYKSKIKDFYETDESEITKIIKNSANKEIELKRIYVKWLDDVIENLIQKKSDLYAKVKYRMDFYNEKK